MSRLRRMKNSCGELRSPNDVMRDMVDLIRHNPAISDREIARTLGYGHNRIGKLRKHLQEVHEVPTRAEIAQEKDYALNAEVQRLWRSYEDSRMVSKVLQGRLTPSDIRRRVGISEKEERDLQLCRKIEARERQRDLEKELARRVRIPRRVSEKERAGHIGRSEDFCVAVSVEGEAEKIVISIEEQLVSPLMTQREEQGLLAEIELLEKSIEEHPPDPKLVALVQELEKTLNALLMAEVCYGKREDTEERSNRTQREKGTQELSPKKRERRELLSTLRKRLPGFKLKQPHPGLPHDEELLSTLLQASAGYNSDLVQIVLARYQVEYLLQMIYFDYPTYNLCVHYYQREKAGE